MAFYLEKPKDFNFIAGQYMTVSLFNPPETDDEGDSRFLSVASAPYEKYLMVATRIRDTAFKRVLKNLPSGSEIKIAGPGRFVLSSPKISPAYRFSYRRNRNHSGFQYFKTSELSKIPPAIIFVLLQQKAGRRGVLKRIAEFGNGK